jgi:hypothetical protein
MFNQYKLWYREEILGGLHPDQRIEANGMMGQWMGGQVVPHAAKLIVHANFLDIKKRMDTKPKLPGILTDIFLSRKVTIGSLQNGLKVIDEILEALEEEIESHSVSG